MDSSLLAREFDEKIKELDNLEIYDTLSSEESLTSVASSRRSSASSRESDASSLDEHDEIRLVGFYEGLGWKKVVFLQHNSFWCSILVITIMVQYFAIVYAYHFSNDETKIMFYTPMGTALLVVCETMYAIDTVLSIVYRNWKSIYKVNVHPPRPAVQLFLDVLTLLPIEYVYWGVSSDVPMKTRVNTYHCLTSHSLIRMYRIFTYFTYARRNLGYRNVLMRVLEMSTYITLMSHAFSAILFISYCLKEDEVCYNKEEDWSQRFKAGNVDTDFGWYITSLYVIVGKCTFKGFTVFPPADISKSLFLVVYMTSFIFFYGYMMGQIVSAQLQEMHSMFLFSHRLKLIKRKLSELKTSKKVYNDIITHYQVLWENRGGAHQSNLHYELLPKILHRDLNLDIFGDAFKRSHLFRHTNESFLSFLSLKMKAEFYMPGDILYKKGAPKTQMIYLVTGIIQILTEEDDESSIISFSGGTCIGEVALLLHCFSTVVVRCATYCQVQVLEKKDFHTVLKNYPNLNKTFQISLQERVNKSRELKEVGTKGLKPTDVIQLEDVNDSPVRWLKTFFQISILAKKKKKAVATSVLRFSRINSDVDRTVIYLDLYVFAEQLELSTDDVCLRTKCPWILKPKSVVLKAWNNIIVGTAIVVAAFLPYYAFYVTEVPGMFIPIMYGVEILYVMDVMIQISTAFETKQELITEWKQIFYLRLSEFGFIADVVAAFPLEIMQYMLHSDVERNLHTVFMLNKLIKLWKVERFFREQEATQLTMTYFLRETKHLLYLVYMIYIFGALFFFQSCFESDCQTPGWYNRNEENTGEDVVKGAYRNFTVSTLYSTIIVVGNSYLTVVPVSGRDIVFTTFGMLLSFLFLFYIFSSTAAMKILGSKDWSLFQERYKSIARYVKEHKMDSNLEHRVLDHLDFCWSLDNAYSLISGMPPIYDLPPYHQDRLTAPTLLPFFTKLPLFKDSDSEFLLCLAGVSNILMLQRGEVVTYSGEPATCMYIIMHGYCQTFSNFTKNNAFELMGPNSVINVVEMCIQLPNINDVRTITCCQLVKIELKKLQEVLVKFPLSQTVFDSLVVNCAEWKDIPELQTSEIHNKSTRNIFTSIRIEDMKYSWFKFRYQQSESESSNDDIYQQHFTKLGYLNFIRFLFMRRTVVPNGDFIIGWEISRAIFACISALLFPAAGALEMYTLPWIKYVRYVLDATAIVDIYVRLHVAFFDYRGVVVTHPLATSKHYLTHGFLVDLLAVLPLQIFGLGKGDDYSFYYYLLFNRILQIHRMVGLLNYFQHYGKLARHFPASFNAVRFFIFGAIACNACGGFLVLIRCEYRLDEPSPYIFTKGIYCEHWQFVIDGYEFEQPLSPLRVYLYNVYFATSLITRCGLTSTMVVRNNNALVVAAISIFGLWMLKFMYAISIAITSTVDVKTTTHQEKMKSLLQFIKTKKITKDLREEVINYFELLWKRKRAKEACGAFDSFHLTLKEDVLLHMYGKKLQECSVFATASRAFLCQLIISCHVEIFLKGSTILRPYEITTTIYFINKGKVDLIVAGNVKACSSLTSGCLFGNLPNALNYSDSLTVVAKGHVEVLAIPSSIFHEQMTLHPKVQKTFNTALEKSPSDFYLSTATKEEDKTDSLFEESPYASSSNRSIQSLNSRRVTSVFGRNVLLPESKFVKVMTVIQLATSYITFFTCTYSLGFGIGSWYFYIFLVASDVIFYIRIYMNFKLAYYDEFGYLVTDPLTIASRYLNIRTQFGLFYDILAVFPLDVFCLIAPYGERLDVMAYLHVNRLLTAVYVIRWFMEQNNKLNINVFVMRFAFIAIWMTMMLHALTCLFCILLCIEDPTVCSETYGDIKESIVYYIKGVFVIISIFTGAALMGKELLPNTPMLILYCIFVMILTQILVSHFIGEACAILESTNRTMTHYAGRVKRLWEFYIINYLSQPLQESLWSYLSLLWRMNKGEQVPELLKEAPYYIREGIKTSLYGEYVQANPVFAACHDDFLRQLITCLKQYIFFPGNYITFSGDMDDNMYFMYSGEVEFLLPTDRYEEEDVRGILLEGDAFGMSQGVYPNREHPYHYRARTVAVLLVLNRTVWNNMLDSFPAVKKEILNKASGFYDEM